MRQFSTASRLKYYRNLLGINQEDLVSKKLSLPLINMLESGKRKLTAATALLLIERFSTIAKHKNVKFEIQLSDLILPEKLLARDICIKTLNEVEQIGIDLDKLIYLGDIILEYDFYDLCANVFLKISDYYYANDDYSEAIGYVERGLVLLQKYDRKKDIAALLNKAGSCYYMQNDLHNAVKYYNRSYNVYLAQDSHDEDYLYKVLFNLALSHICLRQFDAGFSYIEKYLSINSLDIEQKCAGLILKANAYLDSGRYEEALSMYKNIVTIDTKYIYIVQNNMAKTFCRLNFINESIEYFTASIINQLKAPSQSTTHSLKALADIYNSENRIDEAIIFYNYAFNNAINFNQIVEIISLAEILYTLYFNMNQLYKFDYHFSCLSDLYKKNLITGNNIKKYILLKNKCKED